MMPHYSCKKIIPKEYCFVLFLYLKMWEEQLERVLNLIPAVIGSECKDLNGVKPQMLR